jgi:hypothetical protein
MAVASNPLSSTATTEIVIISKTSNRELTLSEMANRNSVNAEATAMMRTGRIREPTRSDQRPTRMRPPAPISCEMVTRPPAAATDQP